MSKLVQVIVGHIRDHVVAAVSRLGRADGEIRTVFHGPPMEILRPIFDVLSEDGGIDAQLADGTPVRVPVLLQLESAKRPFQNPETGKSGICDSTHLIDLRNSPSCPRFVALVEPGGVESLSFSSASDSFGLSQHSNSGTATTGEWWSDTFVQSLVRGALSRHPSGQDRGEAHASALIENAIQTADRLDKGVASRPNAWRALSRVWSISEPHVPFGTQLSLACGVPPHGDGSVDSAQTEVLGELAERFVDSGFMSAIDELKAFASDAEKAALDEFLAYLQKRCGVAHKFGHAPAFYYEPTGGLETLSPPGWWNILTVETWRRLLDGGDEPRPPSDAVLTVYCLNLLMPRVKGVGPVVASEVQLSVVNESGRPGPDEVTVSREVAGPGNNRTWQLRVGPDVLTDDSVPVHRSPVRYSVEGPNLKKTTLRVVSLRTWEPGVVVYSRTATKMSLPKRVRRTAEDVAFELTLALSGQGRHYFDLYVRPGVELSEFAYGSGDDGSVDESRESRISRVGDSDTYGFEVVATGDCFYQFKVVREPAQQAEIFRVYLTFDEATPEQCSSEFDRLIRLNRSRGGVSASADVSVNRQLRSSDLQGWLLAKEQAAHSFRPFVLGPDYAGRWVARDWSAAQQAETIFSNAQFLQDPRPAHGEFNPPPAFLEARAKLFERIRGTDENGLAEAAPLGEWLATDQLFAQEVEQYVESYFSWLDADPDVAAWCDVAAVAALEPDGTTLVQEPDAVLVSPLHPVRLAWHCLAQRTLFLAQRKLPCPAACILDPDAVPDSLVLPLRTASGGIKPQIFFSVECSSDYWAILWNGSRLDRLPDASTRAPFDRDFGVLVGGVSSGFSSSQVGRSLGDVADLFSAKPLLNIAVSSAAGQNNACNEGLLSWARSNFNIGDDEESRPTGMGPRFVQIIDERSRNNRPEEAEISNLAEDTGNAVRWLEKRPDSGLRPDLTIIAQLETSNPGNDNIAYLSPIGLGGLIRHRVREQLSGARGAFLAESRASSPCGPTGDGLADRAATAIARLENLGTNRYGYTFAPSVHAIRSALRNSDYAAVSSSAVDPACFLGQWLEDMYLWDYELPSYSQRAGDSNGYYLLSSVKPQDLEALRSVLSKLPGCESMGDESLKEIILEVARRGIPTVRGLSRGDTGASGDLGLLVASRLIQDEFRTGASPGSILPVLKEESGSTELALVIPVDPFRGYIEDLSRAVGRGSLQRPDLLVAGIVVGDTRVACRLTPVEVKYRGKDTMAPAAAQDALQQARGFSELLKHLRDRALDPDLLLWRLAFQHLVSSMLGFALRVYSQQRIVANRAADWAKLHARIVGALLGDEMELEVDKRGRLVILDGSPVSDARDFDGDGFCETLYISRANASTIVEGSASGVYEGIRGRVEQWELMPGSPDAASPAIQQAPAPPPAGPAATPPASSNQVPQAPAPPEPPDGGPGGLPQGPPRAGSVTPASNDGIAMLIGNTVDGFQSEARHLNICDTNLNQLNIGVVGDLGTGKTQLLKSLVYQIVSGKDANRGIRPRFLIFDYKKDYSADEFVRAVGARVITPKHLPINLFDLSGAAESTTPWLDRFKFFADVLDKIFSGIGPVQRQRLKDAVRRSYDRCREAGRQPSIYDVHSEYRSLQGDKTDSVLAIIDDLVDMELFSAEPASLEGVDKFLDDVLVISLHALGTDDRTKNMLVVIMLNVFYEHMLRIPKRPFVGTAPQLRAVDSFLLVDEADSIMRYEFDVLRRVLLQGREFGVGVILASQYLRHFKAGTTDYREPLLSWFVHKVPNVTPQEISALGLTGDVAHMAERIKTLGMHECLFKTYNVPGEIVKGVPFYKLYHPADQG